MVKNGTCHKTAFPPGSLALTYTGGLSPAYDSLSCLNRCTSFVDPGALVLVLAGHVNDRGMDLRLVLYEARPLWISTMNLGLARGTGQ